MAVQLLQVTCIIAVPVVPLYQSKVFVVSTLVALTLVVGDTGAMPAFKQPVNSTDNKIKYIGFIVQVSVIKKQSKQNPCKQASEQARQPGWLFRIMGKKIPIC
jgi:hypothetical protein